MAAGDCSGEVVGRAEECADDVERVIAVCGRGTRLPFLDMPSFLALRQSPRDAAEHSRAFGALSATCIPKAGSSFISGER